ncbi:hypothetical protein BC332_18382 [Capsicum chinense]|nr:hypothetical protein BC332_18382 [Capsicum chinense]
MLNEIPRDINEVFLTGATSKIGRAFVLYLALRRVRVLVEQIQRWLKSRDEHFLKAASERKGKNRMFGAKKRVLLSGMPGIGKTSKGG